MSSYEVGGVELGASIIAGPIAIGASIAILAPIVGGYAIFSTGKAIYDGLAREHQRALERIAQEQARERMRFEKAVEKRQQITIECKEKIDELKASGYLLNPSTALLAEKIMSELQAIADYDEKNDVNNIEMRNSLDVQRIKELTENLKKEIKIISENKAENLSMLSFIEKIEAMFNGLSIGDYCFVKNIQIEDYEKVEIRKLLEKLDSLKTKFYEIVAREVERAENCPINSYDANRIADIFKCINDELSSVDYTKIEKWLLETKIATIERYIDSYGIYKYELDKEQEKFLELYLRYKESCEKVGDAYREAVEFDSLQELEEEINSRNDMLNRLKDRSALLEELRKESGSDDVARELYICYAIETELNRMNYEIADKTSAETIVGKKLENYRLKDKLLQYYEHGSNSMMQLFKVSDNVGLQLIVHSDGTSTMETVSLNGTENENVIKIQKEHCERTRKLKEVLKQNWGIEIELEEKASADHVAFEFEDIRQKVNNANNYMEIRRKKAIEKRRKNAEKKKERSIALRY